MERRIILERTKNLPKMLGGQIAEDWQIWEGDEVGAHFKITKEILPVPNGFAIYMLSVSGDAEAKEKVILDFYAALGEPIERFTMPEATGVDFVSWHAGEVDARRPK